ncbi:putative sporulation protein YtxC [Paenibacillus sp. y28]|uniref:putative sporulation protein YtxC n=1 Tax=Paenibacillus sp. y28 TaxID=3129110 RepID=UPI0030178F3D
MELFTLVTMEPDEESRSLLKTLVKRELGSLLGTGSGVKLIEEAYPTHAVLRCYGKLPGFSLCRTGEEVYRRAAQAIADYIIEHEERPLLRGIITREYGYGDSGELEVIEPYCLRLLDPSDEHGFEEMTALQRRKNKIIASVQEYFREDIRLHMNGFIRFRLNEYWSELRDVAEYAMDEYVMDKQYQDFISLLKYFVYVQDTKMPVAHLLHNGGHEFSLLNEHMVPIETKPAEVTFELSGKEINFEDMIVSTLITMSPQRIYIHTHEPEAPVIQTIMNIFEHRTVLCTSGS